MSEKDLPNIYDQAARFAVRRLNPEAVLRWLLPTGAFAAWEWTGWVDSQALPFPGEPDRRCDTVARFEHREAGEGPVAVVIELSTRPRGDQPERVAEYCLRVRRELPYQANPRVPYCVVALVVNLTGPEQAPRWSMAPPGFGGLDVSATFGVRTLREESAEELLADVETGGVGRAVLAWVPLMTGGGEPGVLARWRELASAEPDERVRKELGGLVMIFATLVGRKPAWQVALEGWNMEQSEIAMEWLAMGADKANARAARLCRDTILRVLGKRLGAGVPEDVRGRVEAEQDLVALQAWSEAAATAASWDEMRSAFARP